MFRSDEQRGIRVVIGGCKSADRQEKAEKGEGGGHRRDDQRDPRELSSAPRLGERLVAAIGVAAQAGSGRATGPASIMTAPRAAGAGGEAPFAS